MRRAALFAILAFWAPDVSLHAAEPGVRVAEPSFDGLGEPIAASSADWKAIGRAVDGRLRGWKLPALAPALTSRYPP